MGSFTYKQHPVAVTDADDPNQPGANVVTTTDPTAGDGALVVAGTRGSAATPVRIDPTGTTVQPVNVVGGGGINSSVGPTGATVPTSATFVGVQDPFGDLTGVLLGQQVKAQSLPVTVASDQALVIGAVNGPVTVQGGGSNTGYASFDTTTPINTTIDISVQGLNCVTISLVNSGSVTGGTLQFLSSIDGSNFFPVSDAMISGAATALGASTYNFTSGSILLRFNTTAYQILRLKLTAVVTGAAASIAVQSQTETFSSDDATTILNTSLPLPAGASTNAGAPNIASGQQALSSSVVQVVAARTTRRSVVITNLSTTDIFVGASGVTTSTGQLLLGVKGASISIPTRAAVFAIVTTGTPSVSYMECFD